MKLCRRNDSLFDVLTCGEHAKEKAKGKRGLSAAVKKKAITLLEGTN
jgi:hypothetical protein